MSVSYSLNVGTLEDWAKRPIWEREAIVGELNDLVQEINDENESLARRRARTSRGDDV